MLTYGRLKPCGFRLGSSGAAVLRLLDDRLCYAEGEGFEPSDDLAAVNGFRDRVEPAATPHHDWSPRRGGIQGGMNLGRGVCATHQQRSATVLLSVSGSVSRAA